MNVTSLPYSVLTALPPKAYRFPQMFRTGYDTPESDKAQYVVGLEHGKDAEYINICANGTWACSHKDGGLTTSYEGIGYHRSTAALLQGFIDSECTIYVNRYDDPKSYEI